MGVLYALEGGRALSGKYLHRQPQKEKQPQNSGRKQVWLHLWKWIVGAVLLAVLLMNVFTHILQIVNYNGSGMEPGLKGGQTLLILKTQKVEEGDVIAFYYNNQVLVRRVICTGGRQLEIDSNGAVAVNGIDLEEPYVQNATLGQCNITFPYHVRIGTVFVMGDNREEAMDSRLKEIGTIPTDRIIGKVIFKF